MAAPGSPAIRVPAWIYLAAILGLAGFVRVWRIDAFGFNSDEVVYAGQAAAIADRAEYERFFPIFRAHPLLFQAVLSLGYRLGIEGLFERLLSAALGVATVYVVYELGKVLYGRRTGLVAALLMAVMPYHVVVTRQVLLDGPMVMFATLTLWMTARFARTERPQWLYAAAAMMGLTFLSKETSILLLGSLYAFFALSPTVSVRIRHLAMSLAVMALVMAPFPLSVMLGGQARTGENYLAWQLFRRPNHDWAFYPLTVPGSIGPLVLVAALAGLVLLRRERSWRETLLLSWILVPATFFQLWPIKGFQYLLPIAPAVALLAARVLTRWHPGWLEARLPRWLQRAPLRSLSVAAVVATLLVPTWSAIGPSSTAGFLAGTGGTPGGREAGSWISANIPEGSRILTLGPSMANIVQFYGFRKAYGLSVSPNPLHRNPSYEPLPNPDQLIRSSDLQYIIWDAFSAGRSPFFSQRILRYAERYHGRVLHTESVKATTKDGRRVLKPVIVVYEVRP